MVDVVIFGTGSNGERAWRAAAARPDINVGCFVDNDPRKQGTTLHGRPVIAPAALTTRSWHFVVIASMYAADIKRQLTEIGIPDYAVVAPDLNTFGEAFAPLRERLRARRQVALDDGTTVTARELPAVLIVTKRRLGSGDAADAFLQRYFQAWPADRLFNVAEEESGHPPRMASRALAGTSGMTARAGLLARELGERAFAPQIVYAAAASERDLDLLEVVATVVPAGLPVVLHFIDHAPEDAPAFDARVRAMADRVTEIRAASPALARDLSGRYERHVAVGGPMPQAAATVVARDGAAPFRTVMVGDVYDTAALSAVRDVWRVCQAATPALGAIEWYVDPARVQAAIDAGQELGDEIVWRGRDDAEVVRGRVASADLAIAGVGVATGLPPSVVDLVSSGLPVAALAPAGSETTAFLTSTGCGVALTSADPGVNGRALASVVSNADVLARMRAAARRFAAEAPPRGVMERELVGGLVRLARATADAAGTGLRHEGLVRLSGSERVRSARLADVLADRVHYACGRNVLPGWLNLDGFDESYPSGAVPPEAAARIFRLDLTGPHPLPDNYFRLGYSEDFIEHIDQPQLVSFLCEAFRTFRPGGVLRLSSPGLEGVLRRHLRGADHTAARVLHQEAYVQWWHKHFVCFTSLEKIARHIGWRDVRQCAYGESAIPELRLDTRPDQADLNLVVELIK